jgi:hypothetical protein
MLKIIQSNLANDRLPTTTTILGSTFESLKHTATSKQRPPVNSGHKFDVPMVVHKNDLGPETLIPGVARLFCLRANIRQINSTAGRNKFFGVCLPHVKPKNLNLQ